MIKRQLTINIDEETIKEFEKTRDETGIPVSRLIDLINRVGTTQMSTPVEMFVRMSMNQEAPSVRVG